MKWRYYRTGYALRECRLAFIRNPDNDYPIRGTYQAAI
ncbi:hypothetical protein A1Q_2990 [Vibrio campbellii HY01]|nr:hypothetical protein A1Q_2990 [Vibrio campbellii HY01]